jgi:DNA helicase-2/ATP-dependent DNA helicase PcrA
LWSSTVPSRFIDELPEASVEVMEAPVNFHHGGYGGGSRFDRMQPFNSSYKTPGWQRAQQHASSSGFGERPQGRARGPMLIEGELVAKSTGTQAAFGIGARVHHMKFGPGTVSAADGNKLTVDFDKAGRKMVLDSFLQVEA